MLHNWPKKWLNDNGVVVFARKIKRRKPRWPTPYTRKKKYAKTED